MEVKKFLRGITLFISMVLLESCVEPFDIPVRNEEVGFLVIDGYVNTSNNTATVTLSRAVPLSNDNIFPRENNAIVTIEEESGKTYSLISQKNGVYTLIDPGFLNNKRYRLNVRTGSGKQYQSEFITTKSAPPIDSISWRGTEEGVTVVIDTRDNENNTKYYRWEYEEAWQYEAPFSSEYKLVNGVPILRTGNEQIKTCYTSQRSSDIITATTIDFGNDELVDQEIAFVPILSVKTRIHYSILVRQFALSEEAYDYWQQLSINTESLGGLFDPQPSQLRGNIQNMNDADEPVLGYFDGGGVSEKRLFIRYTDLPDYLQVFPGPSQCREEEIIPSRVHELGIFFLITHAVYDGPALVGYMFTAPECADCTKQGGTTKKPDYWPN
jgi:hypothetical protein